MALAGLRTLGTDPVEPGNAAEAAAAAVARLWIRHGVRGAAEPDHVGMAFSGLQQFGQCRATRLVLPLLAGFAASCESPMTREAAHALYGLRRQGEAAEGALLALVPRMQTPDRLSATQVGSALAGLATQSSSPAARSVLLVLTPRVAGCSEPLAPHQLGAAIYGLQGQDATPEARGMVVALTTLVRKSGVDCGWRSGAGAVGMALYGLRRLSSEAEGQQLLLLLARERFPYCGEGLDAGGVAMALYGLAGLSPRAAATVARALREVIQAASGSLTGGLLAMSLYGLQGLDPHLAQGTLSALLPLTAVSRPLDAPRDSMSGQQLGIALYGLRQMCDSEEVRSVFTHLAVEAAACEPLGAAETAMALYGLSSQHDTLASRAVLTALAAPVARYQQPLRVEYGMAIYGLKGQTGTAAARGILAALLPRMRRGSVEDCGKALGGVLQGLQGQSPSPEATAVLEWLQDTLAQMPAGAIHPSSAAPCLLGALALGEGGFAVSDILQELAQRMPTPWALDPGLCQALSLAGVAVPKGLLQSLNRKVAAQGSTEKIIELVLRSARAPGLRFNVVHETGFEMDILCQGCVNVEVCGRSPSYFRLGKQRLRAMRARLLKERFGITVRQVEVVGRDLDAVIADIAAACTGPPVTTPAPQVVWNRAVQLAARGWDYWHRRVQRVVYFDRIPSDSPDPPGALACPSLGGEAHWVREGSRRRLQRYLEVKGRSAQRQPDGGLPRLSAAPAPYLSRPLAAAISRPRRPPGTGRDRVGG
eukprot:TRINITY_DN8695_c0_g1_i1.p1 TRINITY_DN8695_c0_g1~~TRINITY_DN8695_c0_g1_i1.p1  ORF type:complete len:858 (+),score=117.53 TRINITY_DN8695_c0_g1_i1:283-2574(+)